MVWNLFLFLLVPATLGWSRFPPSLLPPPVDFPPPITPGSHPLPPSTQHWIWEIVKHKFLESKLKAAKKTKTAGKENICEYIIVYSVR